MRRSLPCLPYRRRASLALIRAARFSLFRVIALSCGRDQVARRLRPAAFFRTSRGPIEIPALSLAARKDGLVDGRTGVLLPPGVWFPERGPRDDYLFRAIRLRDFAAIA